MECVMKKTIVIITSEYLHSFVEAAFEEFKDECDIIIAEYKNFEHIADMYKKYENIADGFMISGLTAVAAIENQVGELKKPMISFHADIVSFYHALVELFVERRDLDPKRCIFDFMLPLVANVASPEGATVDHLIHNIDFSKLLMDMDKWAESSTTGDFSMIEKNIAYRTIDLWENNKIDMVLCSYSSTMPLLDSKGVPNYFLYPVKDQLDSQIKELLSQIELENYHNNLPATIAIRLVNEVDSDDSKKLKKAIESIKQDFPVDTILQRSGSVCYIYTTYRVLDLISRQFNTDYFPQKLADEYHMEVFTGCGVGKNIAESKKHADNALDLAVKGEGSFIVNERGQLIGFEDNNSQNSANMDMPENIYEIAEKCKLSTVTIQRLIAIARMNGTYEFTASELAEHMGATQRNANRILKNLETGGAAVVAHTRSATAKGRPVKVYRLIF